MENIDELDLNELKKIASQGYGFYWSGKGQAVKDAENDETEFIPYTENNMYIEGDNIIALKRLQKEYEGKIKMIYIDPPYNTGKKFIYNDRFKKKTGKLSYGDGRHSDWLNMMYPRLKVARKLLSDDGVIFISIDDNEVHNLRKVCDELFGEKNFIAEIIRNTNSAKSQSLFVSVTHENCLIYAKSLTILKKKHSEKKWQVAKNNVVEYVNKVKQLKLEGLSNEEITEELKILTKYPRFIDFTNYWYFDENGLYQKGDLGGVKKGNMTPIINPLTGKEDSIPPGGFRYTIQKMEELIKENKIHFHLDGSLPRIKRYLSENMMQRPKSIMSDDQRPDSTLLKKYETPFDNPKQLSFMTRILSISDIDSIVLDFFSGSATTAHAVMQLNAEDGGNRKFIMVQLPEPTPKNSEAEKAGYKNICEIGKERIRRAVEKIKADETLPLENREKLSIDFEVIKI